MPPVALRRAQTYKILAARLKAMQEDIARQSRSRPMAEVPAGTLRLVKRLLTDLRRFDTVIRRQRIVPPLPQGPVCFSALSLFLGEVAVGFDALGVALGIGKASVQAQVDAALSDTSSVLAATAAGFRARRERIQAEEHNRKKTWQSAFRW